MAKEYSLITATFDLNADPAEMSMEKLGDGIAPELSTWLERSVLNAKEHEGQPWQFVSHDVAIVGRHVILSLLMHRQL